MNTIFDPKKSLDTIYQFDTIEEAIAHILEVGEYAFGFQLKTPEEIRDWIQRETKGHVKAFTSTRVCWSGEYIFGINHRLVKKLSKRKGKINLWETLLNFRAIRY